jgi:pectate lyase
MRQWMRWLASTVGRVALVTVVTVLLPSAALAALPADELWREDLVNHVVGFGKNATGGKGGNLCRVTHLDDYGPGSLRACAEATGPKWIIFDVSGTIRLRTEIDMKSHKTIDGRGQDVTIANRGFVIGRMPIAGTEPDTNIIIHNLKMKNQTGGGRGFINIAEDASDVWIDHVTIQNSVDEKIYIGSSAGLVSGQVPPKRITISWCHCLRNSGLSRPEGGIKDHCLLISDPSMPEDVGTEVTLHHNFFDRTWVRHPYARHATIHAFNNYWNGVGYGVQACTNVKFLSENDIFQFAAGYTTNPMVDTDTCSDNVPAASVKVANPLLLNGATVEQRSPETIFNPATFYAYTLQAANETLRQTIATKAGWQTTNPYPP